MPLIRTIQIYPDSRRVTKIGIWHIEETEDFFRARVNGVCTVTHPHKRLQHLAARYLLTALEPDFPLQAIKITASGKPYLEEDAFHFSLAHCGDYAAAVVSRRYRVGIDVEKTTPKVERVAAKFLRPEELDFMDKNRLRQHLTVCWSAKEAVFKWYGSGGVDFRRHIRLQPFPLMNIGAVDCLFQKNGIERSLHLVYRLEDDVVTAWLVDDRV